GSLARQQNPAVEPVWVDLPRTKPFSWRNPERLWRRPTASHLAAFIRRWAPDLINIHGGLRDRFPAVLAACRRTEVPIVQSFHLVPEPFPEAVEAARLKKFSGLALRAARAITFPSSAVKEGFQKISPEAERAQIIRGGVNLEQAVHATPLSRQRPYIFSASRFDLRHKAVDVLIAAFRLLAPEFPEVDLLIAGDGPQRTQIEEMIATCHLEARIYLLSSLPHDELWSLYKGALAFVMLSRMAEGLPLVFFEAMACGTPVIGTRTGGTPEIVIHEENGLLVERNEPGEVAAAIRALLTNAARRETMGRYGYELAKCYDWRAVASRYLELYQSLLASERRAGSNRAQMNIDFPQMPSKS
ncbi:MAG: glycosyltransferase family 4 protein, partial [Deltaproteobacteria bacterium]|nr:glycosyltransferase family 4 protein [Deltaproteobacteria bacterium]